uniref:TRASH domain-containing protein n=1 Tax=Sander lucioperca TaxID=283035 RepID=A0A8D0CYH5_SANLU
MVVWTSCKLLGEVCTVLINVFFSTFLSDGGVLNQTDETEDNCQVNAMKNKTLNLRQIIMNTPLFQRSDAAPMADSNPPMSPSINIKDEPIDEGYDAALLPQSSIRQIKEELEHQEVGVRRECYPYAPAVYVQSAVPAPTPTAIFIPGRGQHVLQAIAPLPLRPPAPIPSSLPALVPAPPRPPPPAVPGSVRCSGCSKVLLKGQTAFQRKGSTQLFCSTVCLTGHLPPANKNRSCFQCNREILQPRDMITIPSDGNTYFYFCGQFCLSVFRHKKKTVDKVPDKWADKRIEHEVTHQGRLHRLCSNACFVTWRKMRQLAMNCCEGCGLYCSSSSGSCQTLTIERTQLNFCGPTCIGTYKQVLSSTLMERDQRGKVQLYCSSACVEQSRPPPHVLTGAAFPCCQCRVSAVPQYHLAMVDGTIRNFCSYDCVSTYRVKAPVSGDTSQPDLTNGTSVLRDSSLRDAPKAGPFPGASSVPPIPQDYPSSVPYSGHHPSHTSVPPLVPHYPAMSSPSVPGQAQARAPADHPLKPAEGGPSDPSKLNCHQCSKQFNTKPLLFSNQGRISMFCSRTCCDQYKTQKNILMVCEFCKQEKVPFDITSYNQQDLIFCSENCKLLFKHDITSRNKDHPWRPCTYCSGIGQKMLHSHYGGKMEEFCKPHCMSQYTVLYYGMGRCDSCRKQSYMTEKLQCLGSVRNFCNLPCLLQYCHLHFETSQHTSSNGTGAPPQAPYGKLSALFISAVFVFNVPFQASTQTDAMGVPVSRRRQMKNKSVLCRPFTMDQESMCQLPAPSTDLAGEEKVKVLIVPVPVPVFIPVPMNMYSQHTPVPMAMPVPVPVPMVVPPQKKDMKDAAVQSEPLAVEEEKQKDRPVYSAGEGSNISSSDPSRGSVYIPFYFILYPLSFMFSSPVANPVDIKEDILQCDSAELSYALSCFIREVRRPNGETYSPDSIFYLCLGIQQYLFMEGRIENIFNDPLYSQFATKISGMLHLWKPKLLPNGGTASSRIVESYLWECKQLGAYSPIVLLNTLLFFCTKNFRFTTLAQHQSLSFTNFTRHSKPCNRLRYLFLFLERYRKRQGEEEGDLEMFENVANPLHCPVRLYEFYLSRCSHWYTFQPLEGATLQSMLTRILAVREVHQEHEAAQHQSPATADNDSLQ